MIGFELRTSGVGSDRSTNCATTTSQLGTSVNAVLRLGDTSFPLSLSLIGRGLVNLKKATLGLFLFILYLFQTNRLNFTTN